MQLFNDIIKTFQILNNHRLGCFDSSLIRHTPLLLIHNTCSRTINPPTLFVRPIFISIIFLKNCANNAGFHYHKVYKKNLYSTDSFQTVVT